MAEKDLSHALEEIGIVSDKDKKVYKFGYTFKYTTDFPSTKSKFNFVLVRHSFLRPTFLNEVMCIFNILLLYKIFTSSEKI
jgi:hypothetical protein